MGDAFVGIRDADLAGRGGISAARDSGKLYQWRTPLYAPALTLQSWNCDQERIICNFSTILAQQWSC